jgi:soluble lytic murein transglycosylase-like protein
MKLFSAVALILFLLQAGIAEARSETKHETKPATKIVWNPSPIKKTKPVKVNAKAKTESRSAYSLENRSYHHIGAAAKLSEEDAARYAQIFAFQDVGNYSKANDDIGKLEDHRLMGHVLYQRYMNKNYTATYKELAAWMKSYPDHPNAQKLYALAQSRKPDTDTLTTPKNELGIIAYHDYDSGQLAQPYMAETENTPREKDIIKRINVSLSDSPSAALQLLKQSEKVFDNTKFDALRARIAESYFHNGKIKEAYDAAAASADRSGVETPLAGWIAGLSAWKLDKYPTAAKYFEQTANSKRSSAWMVAAGAHWAARSYLRSHQPQKVSYWLHRAAENPRSFYGIISAKALGMEQAHFNWKMPKINKKHAEKLSMTPAGKRALALSDAERPDLAEQELRQIDIKDDIFLQESMLALAYQAHIPAFQMRLGSGVTDKKGNLYDAALYPDAPWQPQGGYQVDKALVYAFIRQESKFDTMANNQGSGALGLMQLMPATAQHVANANGIKVDDDEVANPAVNIRLGQKYLANLLRDSAVNNNLFRLAVAYNAGPGKLSRWEKEVDYENDPLLFVESIPVSETRIFVERVLTNYWIYRLKFNQSTESLENVAAGEWPEYVAHDMTRAAVYASVTP